jgi:hypothetical protein
MQGELNYAKSRTPDRCLLDARILVLSSISLPCQTMPARVN